MSDVEEITKAVRCAKTRQEIKNALQSCLDFTKRSAITVNDQNNRSGFWFPIGESLIFALNPAVIGSLSKREYDELVVDAFIRAPAVDTIPLLVHSLKSKNAYALEKILHLLDAVIRKTTSKLFIDFTSTTATIGENRLSERRESIDRLVRDLVSIPDRAAACVRGGRFDEESVLNADSFTKSIASAMIEALEFAHDRLSTWKGDCDLTFLSDLLGKFYLNGYGRPIMQILAPRLYKYCCEKSISIDDRLRSDGDQGVESTDDYVWRRLSRRLFTGVHVLALDSVVADLVIVLSSSDRGKIVDLEQVLGDSVEKEDKIKYVLTTKLLLTRYFDETISVPETIFGYLSKTEQRRKSILAPTLIKLMNVWSSPASIARTDFRKHYYVTKALIIGSYRLGDGELSILRNEGGALIFRGISTHLNAVDENVRKIGMVVGELLTDLFSIEKNEEKLKFDYADDERTKYLKNLRFADSKIDERSDFVSMESREKIDSSSSTANLETKTEKSEFKISTGFDSDDEPDLIPYDLPTETGGDVGENEIKTPLYIRDCLDCISERKSFRHYDVGLRSLENLIRRNSPGADDLATEIVRILLHAEDHYGLEREFWEIQTKTMTACCVKNPKRVADYLTNEFYAKNYSIQHRLLILDVLVAAVKELSRPPQQDPRSRDDVELVVTSTENKTPTPSTPIWRRVVQERLEKKTRRWGSGVTTEKEKNGTPNRLAPIAGPCFFYPLLYEIDKPVDTLDMFGADHIVLGRLLFATGTILYEAENAPGLSSMAATQIRMVLRRTGRHEQPYVRQGSLFALIMALTAIPSSTLTVELQDELLEARSWLEHVRDDDADQQCRQLAAQALSVAAKKVNEGLNSLIEITP